MNKIFLPLALFAVLVLQACGGSGSPASEQIDTLDLSYSTVVIPDELFQKPQALFATQNRLVVLNMLVVDTLVDVFTLDGKPVTSMLPKGEGPDEAAFIFSSTLDAGGNRLLLALKTGMLHALDLSDQSSGPRLSQVFAYSPDSSAANPVTATMENYLLADGTVLSGAQEPGHNFAVMTPDGKFSHYVGEGIPESDFGEGMPDYMRYNFCRPEGAVSPDGKHFACTFGAADMIAFANLTPDSLQVITDYVAPPRGIEVTIGDGWSSFSYNDNYMVYYTTRPVLSDKHVYVGYDGLLTADSQKMYQQMQKGEIEPSTTLRVYDFDGKLRRVLRLNVLTRSFAVSPDDKALYALTETEDGYSCVKFDIPSLD